MIDKDNLMQLFAELDEELLNAGEQVVKEIIIYGGAALILKGVPNRATFDIDIFKPSTLDDSFKAAKDKIAKKHSFEEHWINATGAAFYHELPEGWEERVEVFYEGENLIVKVLGRLDLIFTKFLAELDRGEDLKDLKSLSPTKKDFRAIVKDLKSLEDSESWSKKIDQICESIVGENFE